MWVERLKIQYQVIQAWIHAKRVEKKPITSVKEAIGALQNALHALQDFNDRYPRIGRFFQFIDRKLCIHPLNFQLARLKAIVEKVERTALPHFSHPDKDLTLMKILVKNGVDQDKLLPELASINQLINEKLAEREKQKLFNSLDWYWNHEGKESNKRESLTHICNAPEDFIKAVEYLQMNYGSLGLMKLEDLDRALMDVLPGFARCKLYLDSDLGELILMSMERWTQKHLSETDSSHITECLQSMQSESQGEKLERIKELLSQYSQANKN